MYSTCLYRDPQSLHPKHAQQASRQVRSAAMLRLHDHTYTHHVWLNGWDSAPQPPAHRACHRMEEEEEEEEEEGEEEEESCFSRQTSRVYGCASVIRILVKLVSIKCRCSACAFRLQ